MDMIAPKAERRTMQMAFVVTDIEAACRRWTKATGIGPFFLLSNISLTEINYRGAPSDGLDFSVAIAQSGGVQIELIEQHCDRPSAYRDLIASGASGFHHMGLYCDEYDANFAWYARQGYVPAVDGKLGDMRFAYFDTSADLGCMVELIEQNPAQDELFARIAAAAEGWDGVTDPIRPGFPAA